ncbi:GAF domain-containing protein [Streptomyces virginiae]|uniref:GAF domain-containing protein n=1 Tax=Streptomyces virginiae TaxID=1961 RepID=UPI0036BA8405
MPYHLTHLAEADSVQDVTDVVADQVVPAFGPQGLVLMSAHEGRLHVIGHRGYSTEFINRFDGTPLTSRTPTAHARATGDAVSFPDFADFRRTYPDAPRSASGNAWAFLPLTASGHSIGSPVLSYDQPRPFPPTEPALLASLAGLIAQALDRARLYDAQHTLAHTVQTGLLPPPCPTSPALTSPPATSRPATAWLLAATSTTSSTLPPPSQRRSATSKATTPPSS